MSPGNNLKRYPNKSLSTETRHYGYIQTSTPVSDGRGGESISWVNAHSNPHAFAVLPLSAKQVMEYESINVEATHLIKMRGEIEITELNRLYINSTIYEVLTVEDIQDRGIVKWAFCKQRRD